MNHIAARLLILAVICAGCGWSIYCHCRPHLGEPATTTRTIQKLVTACPAIGLLLVLLAHSVLCDALPGVNHWVVFMVLALGILLGHCLWWVTL